MSSTTQLAEQAPHSDLAVPTPQLHPAVDEVCRILAHVLAQTLSSQAEDAETTKVEAS